MNTLFHLAFPMHDFSKSKQFYQQKLGFEVGRESKNALIFQFDNHQIVGHKIGNQMPEQEGIYPRHFGLIFLEKEEFAKFIVRLKDNNVPFEIPLKTRFPNTAIEHQSFFLKDPSNNLLEFKYYTNKSAIFGELDYREVGETL